MKNTITNLLNQKSELKKQLKLVETAIKALQNLCQHKREGGEDAMEWYGNGHNKDYFRCGICNHEDYR
jgi:hypothetical protein